MAEITVSVNSRPFQVVCRDGEEAQVSQLAEDLAARVALFNDWWENHQLRLLVCFLFFQE